MKKKSNESSFGYRKELRVTMLNKMTDCDELVDKLTEEARSILNSNNLNFPRIAQICLQVNAALCERELLGNLRQIKVPKRSKCFDEKESPI
jgi:hypothetical protein